MDATTAVSMRLPASLVTEIDRQAVAAQRSRTNMLRVLITSALAEQANNNEETN
jgi:metal-responsive CopG/Arc/MetJ family transcriptional regulator